MEINWKEHFARYHFNRVVTPDGELRSETHSHGILDIALMIEYADGKKVGETYFLKKKMTTRAKYEKVRVAYPQMPPADFSKEDSSIDLLKAVARERKAGRMRLVSHQADPKVGRKLDSFCRELIQNENSENAAEWIKNPKARLGELSRRASRELIAKLLRDGALRVHACEISREPDMENTGHLVVELPESPSSRRSLLRTAGNWAMKQGFEPTPDDGQSMVYIKLD